MGTFDNPHATYGDATNTPERVGDPTGDAGPAGELQGENERLRRELADVRNEVRELWRTLRTVAPEYVVTADEMRAIVENPVPFGDAIEYAERLLGSADGR